MFIVNTASRESVAKPKSSIFKRPSGVTRRFRRFEVTMQHARRMRRRQALRQLKTEMDDFLLRQGSGSQTRVQRQAGHQFADQVIEAVEVVEVVDGLNGGMIQPGEDAGFVAEPLAGLFVVKRAGSQHLDGKLALQLFVVGAVNDTHAASADLLLDAIASKLLAYVWHASRAPWA